MPRKAKTAVRRASSATTKTTRKRTTATKPAPRKRIAKAKSPRKRVTATKAKKTPEPQLAKPESAPAARPIQRTSDVPIDLIAEWYTPKQTSLRASFRSDGADLQNDQEIPLGDGDGFEDEDHFTNKSGDTRIGTHGRVQQQAEARTPVRR